MLFDLLKFNKYKEDNRREVKKAKGGLPNSLWETYSSFANCYGGVIILGVDENEDGSWKTTGLENERKLLKEFWDTINNRKKVSMNLLSDKDVETFTEENTGHVIIVIHVPPAKREWKPIYLNEDIMGNTFRRNWEGDYRCSQSEVKAMLRDQPENTMDMKVIEALNVYQLNMESINSYRNRHRSFRPAHPWSNLTDEEYLQRIGAADVGEDGKIHPTAAGLLMFGDEFRIVREFPEYFLDYREILDPTIRWTDRFYSSTGEWSGNLFDFYFRVYNKIVKDVKIPFKMIGGDRIDDTSVHKAIREVLANCLINTDFFGPRGIVIKKEENSLIFENPGYIRVGKYQMKKGGESDPRNKTLMKMFNLIDIGERAGSGVPELFTVWENEGWEEPVIEERFGDASRTSLALSFKKKSEEKIGRKNRKKKSEEKNEVMDIKGKTQEKIDIIYEKMECGIDYKLQDISDIIGLKHSRTSQLLKMMVDLQMISENGTTKAKRYQKIDIDYGV